MSYRIVVSPAYGRDYKSFKAVLEDWDAGKDFRIESLDHGVGRYINREDFLNSPELRVVEFRFQKFRKQGILQKSPT